MKVLVLFSGGVDSTTALYLLRKEGHECQGLFVQYGQRHWEQELKSVTRIATQICLPLHRLDMPDLGRLLACPLTGNGDIPLDAHHEDRVQNLTVVPNRNLILLSAAAGLAERLGLQAVAIGPHRGDAAVYKDCRPAFLAEAERAICLATNQVRVMAPLLHLDKTGVVAVARELGVPLEWCWTCYEGKDVACGRCGACLERKGAGA